MWLLIEGLTRLFWKDLCLGKNIFVIILMICKAYSFIWFIGYGFDIEYLPNPQKRDDLRMMKGEILWHQNSQVQLYCLFILGGLLDV